MEKSVVKFVVFNEEDFGYWKNRTRNYLLSQGRAISVIERVFQSLFLAPATIKKRKHSNQPKLITHPIQSHHSTQIEK
jgi:hypothetical protein